MSTTPPPRSRSTTDAVRQIAAQNSNLIELGYKVMDTARRAKHSHVTDKELFFAGAGFVFDLLQTALDPDKEPTDADLQLMTKIYEELTNFHLHFNQKLKP